MSHTESKHLGTQTINTGPKGVLVDAGIVKIPKNETKQGEKNDFIKKLIKPIIKTSSDEEIQFEHILKKKQMKTLIYERYDKENDTFLKENYSNIGQVIETNSIGFLEMIENCTRVLVLIYDKSQESLIIKNCFSDMAARYLSVQFIKISYEEVDIDPLVVPAILGYKNAEILINMMRVIDEISPGKNVTADDIEHILINNPSFSSEWVTFLE
ncbi:hypothetical protein PCANB_002010 [Pneumocystis canis]|nr:hypothetical protein PCK1_001879 [Pneumocystis canis]KAG5439436.1 hypothetical protein PCANB_002010 [Pneumocystis canis]